MLNMIIFRPILFVIRNWNVPVTKKKIQPVKGVAWWGLGVDSNI